MPVDNKAIVRQFLVGTQNDKDLAVIDALIDESFIGHTANLKGVGALKRAITENLASFPDLQVTIEDQIGEGDRVVTRYTARGTHRRVYRGIQPTDQQVEFMVVCIHRVTDGKITEGWRIVDRRDIERQIAAAYGSA